MPPNTDFGKNGNDGSKDGLGISGLGLFFFAMYGIFFGIWGDKKLALLSPKGEGHFAGKPKKGGWPGVREKDVSGKGGKKDLEGALKAYCHHSQHRECVRSMCSYQLSLHNHQSLKPS